MKIILLSLLFLSSAFAYEIYESDSFYYYLDPIKDRIKDKLRQGLLWEKNDVQVFLHLFAKPNTTVIDVGAHIGVHAMKLAKLVSPSGKVIAFEPQPKLYRELCMNFELNGIANCELHCEAVGSKKGQIELTPLLEGNEGATSLLAGGIGKTVDLITLDELHLSNVSLLLIDVEGMEGDVIEGARDTIAKNRPVILVEIAGGKDINYALPEEKQQIYQTIEMIESHDYDVRKIWGHEYLAIPREKGSEWLSALPDSLRKSAAATRAFLKTAPEQRTFDELLQGWTGEYLRTSGRFQLQRLFEGIQSANPTSLKTVAILWNEGGQDDVELLLSALFQNSDAKIIALANQIQLLREWEGNAPKEVVDQSRSLLQLLRGTHPKLEQALSSALANNS